MLTKEQRDIKGAGIMIASTQKRMLKCKTEFYWLLVKGREYEILSGKNIGEIKAEDDVILYLPLEDYFEV